MFSFSVFECDFEVIEGFRNKNVHMSDRPFHAHSIFAKIFIFMQIFNAKFYWFERVENLIYSVKTTI